MKRTRKTLQTCLIFVNLFNRTMLTQFVIFAGNNMSGSIGLEKVENIKKIYVVTFHFISLPGGLEVFPHISKKMFFGTLTIDNLYANRFKGKTQKFREKLDSFKITCHAAKKA